MTDPETFLSIAFPFLTVYAEDLRPSALYIQNTIRSNGRFRIGVFDRAAENGETIMIDSRLIHIKIIPPLLFLYYESLLII